MRVGLRVLLRVVSFSSIMGYIQYVCSPWARNIDTLFASNRTSFKFSPYNYPHTQQSKHPNSINEVHCYRLTRQHYKAGWSLRSRRLLMCMLEYDSSGCKCCAGTFFPLEESCWHSSPTSTAPCYNDSSLSMAYVRPLMEWPL